MGAVVTRERLAVSECCSAQLRSGGRTCRECGQLCERALVTPLFAWEMSSYLTHNYGIPKAQAEAIVRIAAIHGAKAEAHSRGYLTVRLTPSGSKFVLQDRYDGRGYGKPARAIASTARVGYDRTLPGKPRNRTLHGGNRNMPRRAQVAEPEPVAEEPKSYTQYADKAPTVTMEDFAEWLVDEVFGGKYPGDFDSFMDGVRLGGTLRMEFQQSAFNKTRRADRQAERATGNGDAEPEAPAAKAPTRRGRAAAPAAKATPAPAGKPPARPARGGRARATAAPAPEATAAPARPARARRGSAAAY
jgi:hypothetical protein